ncbi:collagenase [Bacillus sp. TE8-1]|uniref:collagenase n=1 Tax=Bacillus sp. TE8-1 TaxID=2217829 RepID=UPI0011ED0B17|nr:collagenase [Bacillus sp. TE8-1]KAA0780910.1 collagenase [Bacillus sp. TE8-1]
MEKYSNQMNLNSTDFNHEKYLKEPIGMFSSGVLLETKSKIDIHPSPKIRSNYYNIYQKPLTLERPQLIEEKYSMADLIKLNNEQLVNLLVTIEWEQITDLFQFNDAAVTFYNDLGRIEELINALYTRGKLYTKDDAMGIETLVEVIRAGFYLAFYYVEFSQLNQRSFHDKCLPALKAIAANPNFTWGTKVQSTIIQEYGLLINNASCDVEVVNLVYPILKEYYDNLDKFIENSEIGAAVYALLSGVNYDLETYLLQTGSKPEDTIWYGKIDEFINVVINFALLGNVTQKNSWIINNGIYHIANLGKFHSTPNKGNRVLTNVLVIYPYLSEQYLWAVDRISFVYGGIDADGNVIEHEKIVEEGKGYYLPKTYMFDNNSIVFRTGNEITEETVKRLYWAIKEVKAQFHRIIVSDEPIENEGNSEILVNVIYNNPNEYQLNRLLYVYDTNNGGIYIEKIGTLFTYDRTSKESIYSLEDLVRHEFTHYLQGRYVVPGLWGDSDIYNNERLTWFEEGNAEFLAGATRMNNILPRRSVIEGLSSNQGDSYSALQVLHARYGMRNLYNYCFAMQSHMYNNHVDIFNKIYSLIRTNDVVGYDAYIESLGKDEIFNQGYQAYVQMLKSNQEQYPNPRVSGDYLLQHYPKLMSEVAKMIQEEFDLTSIVIKKYRSQFFNTFTLCGSYIGGVSKGEHEDWKVMNKVVDNGLKYLTEEAWSGYRTLTAYFKNYRVNSSNQFEYDVVIHGVNTEEDG